MTLRGDLQPAVLRGCPIWVKRTTIYLVPGGGTHHLGIMCQACNLLSYVNSLNPQSELGGRYNIFNHFTDKRTEALEHLLEELLKLHS